MLTKIITKIRKQNSSLTKGVSMNFCFSQLQEVLDYSLWKIICIRLKLLYILYCFQHTKANSVMNLKRILEMLYKHHNHMHVYINFTVHIYHLDNFPLEKKLSHYNKFFVCFLSTFSCTNMYNSCDIVIRFYIHVNQINTF